jgi:hypothetical protein
MNYPNFYEKITAQYGVEIVGWPCRFVNPSDLNQTDLSLLRDAWANKTCYFRKLTREERAKRAAQHEDAVAAGKVQKATRKPRSDKGGRHSYRPRHAISNAVIEDDSDNDGTGNNSEDSDGGQNNNDVIDNHYDADTDRAHTPSVIPVPSSDTPVPDGGRGKRIRYPAIPGRLPQLAAPPSNDEHPTNARPTKKRRTK